LALVYKLVRGQIKWNGCFRIAECLIGDNRFNPDDLDALKNILEGRKTNNRITWRGPAKSLGTVFYKLKVYHYILSDKGSKASHINQADVSNKQNLLSSIFPEKLVFDGEKCRTPRVNEVLRLILLKTSRKQRIKKGHLTKNLVVSPLVELEGFEPSSRQDAKIPSTCLATC